MMQVEILSVLTAQLYYTRIIKILSASLLFVLDFGSLVFVSYQGDFVSYRYISNSGLLIIGLTK